MEIPQLGDLLGIGLRGDDDFVAVAGQGLQQIATRTINATHAAWRVSQSGAFFLGGLDTMWDVQGRAYVTEVQGDPGHGMPHALWRETTQRVVGGALDIVLATVTVDAERSMTRLDGWQLLIDLGRMPHYYAAP